MATVKEEHRYGKGSTETVAPQLIVVTYTTEQ